MMSKCYKCNHSWDYKGKSKCYLTCPKCLYKLRVDKALGNLPNQITSPLPNELPNKIPNENTYLPNQDYERVYFPGGFNYLIHKSIAHRFKELDKLKVDENYLQIRIIPADPIKLIEHQKNYS